MGLFSGGGFLGKIGEGFGINTTRAEAAARQAGAQSIQGQEDAIAQLQESLGISRTDITGGTAGAIDTLRGGQQAAQGFGQQGIQAIQAGGQAGVDTLDPFVQAGTGSIDFLQNFGTADQLGQTLGSLGGLLDPLIADRQRASEFALAKGGLSRSGRAAEAAADIDFSTRFGIANQLNQQRFSAQQGLFQGGLGAAGQTAGIQQGVGQNVAQGFSGLGAIEQNTAGSIANAQLGEAQQLANLQTGAGVNISNTLRGIGDTQAATTLGVSNIKQSGKQAAGNLALQVGGAIAGGGLGGIPGFGGGAAGIGGTVGGAIQNFAPGTQNLQQSGISGGLFNTGAGINQNVAPQQSFLF